MTAQPTVGPAPGLLPIIRRHRRPSRLYRQPKPVVKVEQPLERPPAPQGEATTGEPVVEVINAAVATVVAASGPPVDNTATVSQQRFRRHEAKARTAQATAAHAAINGQPTVLDGQGATA